VRGLSEPVRTTLLTGLSDVAMPESVINLHPARRSSAPLMELVVTQAMMDGVYAANRGNLEAVLAQTRTLSCLIEDLRILALADAGRLGLHKTELNPADTLRGRGRSASASSPGSRNRLHFGGLDQR